MLFTFNERVNGRLVREKFTGMKEMEKFESTILCGGDWKCNKRIATSCGILRRIIPGLLCKLQSEWKGNLSILSSIQTTETIGDHNDERYATEATEI